jgi:hypothetical protein
MAKKPREPLKLMPLDELGTLLGKVAVVPKDAIAKPKPEPKKPS